MLLAAAFPGTSAQAAESAKADSVEEALGIALDSSYGTIKETEHPTEDGYSEVVQEAWADFTGTIKVPEAGEVTFNQQQVGLRAYICGHGGTRWIDW